MKPVHFVLIIFGITIYWMAKLYEPFLSSIVIASLLAIATSNLYMFFDKYFKSRMVASTLSTVVLALMFFFPIVYFFFQIANILNHIDTNAINEHTKVFTEWLKVAPDNFGFLFNLLPSVDEINAKSIASNIIDWTTQFGKIGLGFLKDIFLILIFYLFVLIYGKDIFYYIKDMLPLKDRESTKLFIEVSNTMGVVFYSILVTAMFEGILFGIIAQVFGYNGLLFGIIYGFASLIPVIGGFIVWFPLSSYEFATGSSSGAITIIVYSIVVISIIADTFIKPLIIKWINKKIVKVPTTINELLIFFSIIAGLSTFGFWGMILGPAVTSLFIAIIRLYKEMYNNTKN
jgi:predicted PurR-regulated permease PerM